MLSFFRKLSIGGKIRDGLLPDSVMGTAEDIVRAKSQNELVSKDETELKESIYGTNALSRDREPSLVLMRKSRLQERCSARLFEVMLLYAKKPKAYWNNDILYFACFFIDSWFASDLLRTIKDPEKPQTLEQLDVVYEDCIAIQEATPGGVTVIRVEFNPTVPHCSLATLIGLCIRIKLERHLLALFKLDIYIKEGAHSTEQESKLYLCCI